MLLDPGIDLDVEGLVAHPSTTLMKTASSSSVEEASRTTSRVMG